MASLVLLLCAQPAAASEVNLDGVSGLLNTPTAEVIDEGDVSFNISRHLNTIIEQNNDFIERSYSATIGYLPGVEVSLRFADFPEREDSNNSTNFQDRSAAIKVQLFSDEDLEAAVGILDMGGESQTNEAIYGALTYHAGNDVDLTAGFGTERFENGFAGLRWTPHERVSLIGEYDGTDTNYGLEVRPFDGLTLKGGMVSGHGAFGASYRFSIDQRGKDTLCCPVDLARCETEYAENCDMLYAVRDRLIEESFENVLVGGDGETLIVQYESRRFQMQQDALAVASLIAVQHAGPSIKRIVVTPKLEDVPQLTLHAGVDELLAFLAEPGSCPDCVTVSPYEFECSPDTEFVEEGNKKPGGADVQLRLINNFVVTRPFEPSWRVSAGLGLQEELYLARAWKLRARQDWNLFNDIEEKTEPENRDAFLNYFDAWNPNLYVLSNLGYFGDDRYGGTAEAAYFFDRGRFKLGGRYALISDNGNAMDSEDGVALAEIGYYEPRHDWEVTALAGQFLEGDEGLRFESTRQFGRTSLTLFAYDTDESTAEGGFRFFVPLPWFNERRHDSIRLTGAPYFGYEYRTDSAPFGLLALPGQDISTARQLLRPEYVEQHLDDFRRAALLYLDCCD